MTKQEILDAAKHLYEMERSTRGYATVTTELATGEKLTITPRSEEYCTLYRHFVVQVLHLQ